MSESLVSSHAPVFEPDFFVAEQCEREMRQRSKITGGAERTLGENNRGNARIKKSNQIFDQFQRNT